MAEEKKEEEIKQASEHRKIMNKQRSVIQKNLKELFREKPTPNDKKLIYTLAWLSPSEDDIKYLRSKNTIQYDANVQIIGTIGIGHKDNKKIGPFKVQVYDIDPQHQVFSALLTEFEQGKSFPDSLTNTVKIINEGWLPIVSQMMELTTWTHSCTVESIPARDTFDYKMTWTAEPDKLWYRIRNFYSTQNIIITSSVIDGDIKFIVQAGDKEENSKAGDNEENSKAGDKEKKTFKINEIGLLNSHISNLFNPTIIPWKRAQYTQLTRIEAVLDNILIK